MNITEFCTLHEACSAGRDWALATGCQTMDELWQRDDVRPNWRVWIATRPGVFGDQTIQRFIRWCESRLGRPLTAAGDDALEASWEAVLGADAWEEEQAAHAEYLRNLQPNFSQGA